MQAVENIQTVTRSAVTRLHGIKSWTWREWIRPVYVTAYLVFCVGVVPVIIWDLSRNNDHAFQRTSWAVSSFSALVAIGVSIYGILSHVVYFTKPNEQRYIVRILLMVPIYALNSSFAMRLPKTAIYLDSIRQIYQALVIYSFVFYLMHYLYDHYDLEERLAQKPQMKSPVPFCCFKPGPNRRLVYRCRNGTLNFVIIQPLCTFIAIITYTRGKYSEGSFSITGVWFWLVLISAMSQVWAMYCLTIFYATVREEIEPLRPIPQFTCVKLAIFGSFFQELFVNLLVDTGVIPNRPEWNYTNLEYSKAIQSLLVTLEMAIVSCVHLYAFPHKPYKYQGKPLNFCKACCSTFDVRDFKEDIVIHSERMKKEYRNRKKKDDEQFIVTAFDQEMVEIQPGPNSDTISDVTRAQGPAEMEDTQSNHSSNDSGIDGEPVEKKPNLAHENFYDKKESRPNEEITTNEFENQVDEDGRLQKKSIGSAPEVEGQASWEKFDDDLSPFACQPSDISDSPAIRIPNQAEQKDYVLAPSLVNTDFIVDHTSQQENPGVKRVNNPAEQLPELPQLSFFKPVTEESPSMSDLREKDRQITTNSQTSSGETNLNETSEYDILSGSQNSFFLEVENAFDADC